MRWVIIGLAVFIVIIMLRRRGGTDLDVNLATATDADVDRLILAGRKIEAIKVYRHLHGTDLKDAKQAVEDRARTLPSP
jgi:ribosomal protein L7/L12